MNKIQLKEEV
ncbi:MAG: hypothetical protein IIW52_09030 [Alistipes sp.]|nr:hypothetical protein [Alistipes sp.]